MMKYNIGKTRLLTLGLLAALLLCGPTACMAGIWQGSGQSTEGVVSIGPIVAGNLPVWENSGALRDSGLVVAGFANFGDRVLIVPVSSSGYDWEANWNGVTNAYAEALTMSPSEDARVTIILPPGHYELPPDGANPPFFSFTNPYIDIRGLVSSPLTVDLEYGCKPTGFVPPAKIHGNSYDSTIVLGMGGEFSDLHFDGMYFEGDSTESGLTTFTDVYFSGEILFDEPNQHFFNVSMIRAVFANNYGTNDPSNWSVGPYKSCYNANTNAAQAFFGHVDAYNCTSVSADFSSFGGDTRIMCDNAGTLMGITTQSGAGLPLNQVAGDARFLRLSNLGITTNYTVVAGDVLEIVDGMIKSIN